LSEDPGFTPNSPVTRKAKRSYLFLIVLSGLAIATGLTVIVHKVFGEVASKAFLFAWFVPLGIVCRRLWIGLQRRAGTGSPFDRFWGRWS